MQKLRATMHIVTPVFCGGAAPNETKTAEIRPFSLRGALRWWYRALDPQFLDREKDLFGATTGTGSSSPVRLGLDCWIREKESYEGELKPSRAQNNGAAYLGYTLYLGKNDRRAVPKERDFTVTLSWQWTPKKEGRRREDPFAWVPQGTDPATVTRRAWAASLWLFGHLGGLGTRSRRGFGTIALVKWEGWPECEELRPAHGAISPQEWKARFEQGFQRIRQWFPAADARNLRHQHLPESFQIQLSGQPVHDQPHAVLRADGQENWIKCLEFAGTQFRSFRAHWNVHKPELLAAFGLPIRFRRAGLWNLKDWNRSASRLHFRVVQIAGTCHALAWRADGPLAPTTPIDLRGPNQNRRYDDQHAEGDKSLLAQFLSRFAQAI